MTARGVLRRGRIQVDARRAVAKLRDHLLLDPDTWALEVVRVAVMSGATGVAVEHDADDLQLSWDGDPPPKGSLGRLLDFALESARDPATRRLRLLAIAVNASLATRPSRVEISSGDGPGLGVRVAFDPRMLEVDDDEVGGAAAGPRVEPAPADPRGATRLWLRKGFGWGTFLRFATGRPLREVTLLAEATQSLPIPIHFEPEVPIAPRPPPLLRVDLEPHGIPGATLEVRRDGGRAPARATFSELGVRLATLSLPSTDGLRTEGAGVHLPIDVHLDAPSWPTNASRSQIDEREARSTLTDVLRVLPEVARALDRMREGRAPELAGAAAGAAAATGDVERALSAFACCAASSDDDGPIAFVLDLPIARDAVGRPLTPRALALLARRAAESAGAERLFVHRGREPLPEAFGPFAGDVPWLRGHPLDALLASVSQHDFAEVAADVAEGIRRRDALLALEPSDPTVPRGGRELFRVRFEEREGPLAGLAGELVVHLREREPATIRWYLERRPLATTHPDAVFPLEAAVEWPGRLRPTLRHDAVAEDAALAAATRGVLDRAARELAARAALLSGPDAPTEGKALARAALASSAEARTSALAEAAIWPLAAGGWASLRELAAARLEGALPFVQHAPRPPRAAPDGRLVPVLDAADAVRLGRALGEDPTLVPYGPALAAQGDELRGRVSAAHRELLARELEAQGVTETVALAFDLGCARGIVASAKEGRILRTHAGVALDAKASALGAPVVVVIEEDSALPSPGWDGVLAPKVAGRPAREARPAHASPLSPTLERLATVIASRAAADDHAGGEDAGAEAPSESAEVVSLAPRIGHADAAALRAFALRALAEARRGRKTLPAWAKPLDAVPVATLLDEDGMPRPATIAEVKRRHGASSAPCLREPPGFWTLSWWPLLVERRDQRAPLQAALGLTLEDGERALPHRKELARVEAARRALMARPLQPFAGPIPGADPRSPIAEDAGSKGERAGARALCALRDGDGPAPCHLRFSGREVGVGQVEDVPGCVAFLVEVSGAASLERWATLSATGRTLVAAAARSAAAALAEELLRAAAGRTLREEPLSLPGALALLCWCLASGGGLRAAIQKSTVRLPTAFGGEVPLASVAAGDRPIPVARRTFGAEAAALAAEPPVLVTDAPLEALLLAIGPSLDDVTGPLERAAAPEAQAPAVLAGAPEHPALRASLEELGVTLARGELELAAGDASRVEVHLHDGAIRTLAPELPFALRGVARPSRVDTRPRAMRDLSEALAAAAFRLLLRAAADLPRLPPVARIAVQRTVLSAAARGERPRRELAAAPAFIDLAGQARSLADLLDRGAVVTTDPPPYPSSATSRPGDAVLAVDAAAAQALRRAGVSVKDVSADLRLDLDAEARRSASPVEPILAPRVREGALSLLPLAAPLEGEVAVLPGHMHGEAGVRVLLARRPLCALPAPEGWPVAAVVSDDRLTPNRRHDGLAPAKQSKRLLEEIARTRDAALLRACDAPPPDALAELEIGGRDGAGGGLASFRGLRVIGRAWLAATGPGRLRVRWAGAGPGDQEMTLEAPSVACPGFPAAIPVGGDLFVVPTSARAALDLGARATLARLAISALGTLASEALRSGRATDVLLWRAALLGASVPARAALDAQGKERMAAEILGELRRRGALWITRHGGLAAGEFPDDAPQFILLDDGAHPLFELLRAEAPAALRELGGLPLDGEDEGEGEGEGDDEPRGGRAARAPRDGGDSAGDAARGGRASHGEPTGQRKQRPKKKRRRKAARPAPAAHAPAARPPAAEGAAPRAAGVAPGPEAPAAAPGTSWLSRIGTAVADTLRGGPRVPLEPGHRMTSAAADAAHRLGRDAPPPVVAVPRGRPIAYDASRGELLVVLEHPAVAALLEDGELEVLAAAIASELNRGLPSVTDAEEARVVHDLLAARAERA